MHCTGQKYCSSVKCPKARSQNALCNKKRTNVMIVKARKEYVEDFSVLWEKPMTGEFEIILIHENLGY